MSRSVDKNKLKRIREASLKVISRNGIGGSSVAAIAAEAQVSVGYLYRYYPSKEVLIDDILKSSLAVLTGYINSLMETHDNIEDVIRGVVGYIINGAEKEEEKYKFMIMLLNDFSVKIADETVAQIEDVADAFRARFGKHPGGKFSTNDLYIAFVGIPLEYAATHFRFGFGFAETNRSALIEKITSVSMNILTKNNPSAR